MKRTEYRVVAWFGNSHLMSYGVLRRNDTYAQVPTRASAEKLVEAAKKLGYRDAHIREVQVEERKTSEKKESAAGVNENSPPNNRGPQG